jgi:lipopolysaccharide/colanic/teichoic acid biosynthesis glycosyltransferase
LTQSEFNGALATNGRVGYIIVSRLGTKNFVEHENILQAQMNGARILDYRSLDNRLRGHLSLHDTDLWTFLAGSVRQNWFQLIYRGFKFYAEPVAAALMLVVLAPLFLVVAVVIKLTSPGPVFFSQIRTGYLGRPFYLIKFRSMRADAEAGGAKWATKTDDRVTPVGRFLRKSRIDELPQLWNVVCGEMSFMGPRPERPEFYEIIGKEVPAFKLRLLVRPGITGWAQLLGGYAASIEESERKLEYDLFYMQYLSPRMDLTILGRTLVTLVRGNSGQ